MTPSKTRVIFRVDKSGDWKNAITAVFVDLIETCDDDRLCYERIGQHGTCSIGWVKESTRPAKPHEYKALSKELTEVIGYDLKILNSLQGLRL